MVENGDHQPPLRHQGSKSKDWLQNAGIGIEKRRRSSTANNYRIENNRVIIENEDGTTQELEIVASKEKHGKLRKAVPELPVPLAVICLILNIIPGLGTLFSGLVTICGGYESQLSSRTSTCCWNVVAALLQVILSPILVGWIWSLHRGVLLIQLSLDKKIKERGEQLPGGPA